MKLSVGLLANATDKEINDIASGSHSVLFTIFLLSRGVYNLKKETLIDYNRLAVDLTDDSYLHEWMEFDKMYIFKQDDLKKEAKSVTQPFTYILPIGDASKMILIDGSKFLIKLVYKTKNMVISFMNIIECWKFYYYGRVLYYNSREFFKSLRYKIDLNMRILLDEYRQSSIGTVLSAMINVNNVEQNKILAEKTKKYIEEDQINFQALTHLYQRMLIALYSMDEPEKQFQKLKIITEQFHRYYFQFIKDLFSNPYTDVN